MPDPTKDVVIELDDNLNPVEASESVIELDDNLNPLKKKDLAGEQSQPSSSQSSSISQESVSGSTSKGDYKYSFDEMKVTPQPNLKAAPTYHIDATPQPETPEKSQKDLARELLSNEFIENNDMYDSPQEAAAEDRRNDLYKKLYEPLKNAGFDIKDWKELKDQGDQIFKSAKMLRVANEHLESNPDDVQWKYAAAVGETELGRNKEARTRYEDIIATDPKFPSAYTGLSYIYGSTGNNAMALSVMDDGIAANPDKGELWANRAVYKQRVDDYAGALKDLEHAAGIYGEEGNKEMMAYISEQRTRIWGKLAAEESIGQKFIDELDGVDPEDKEINKEYFKEQRKKEFNNTIALKMSAKKDAQDAKAKVFETRKEDIAAGKEVKFTKEEQPPTIASQNIQDFEHRTAFAESVNDLLFNPQKLGTLGLIANPVAYILRGGVEGVAHGAGEVKSGLTSGDPVQAVKGGLEAGIAAIMAVTGTGWGFTAGSAVLKEIGAEKVEEVLFAPVSTAMHALGYEAGDLSAIGDIVSVGLLMGAAHKGMKGAGKHEKTAVVPEGMFVKRGKTWENLKTREEVSDVKLTEKLESNARGTILEMATKLSDKLEKKEDISADELKLYEHLMEKLSKEDIQKIADESGLRKLEASEKKISEEGLKTIEAVAKQAETEKRIVELEKIDKDVITEAEATELATLKEQKVAAETKVDEAKTKGEPVSAMKEEGAPAKVYTQKDIETISDEGRTPVQKKILQDVKNVVKAVSKLVKAGGKELSVVIHESRESFRKAIEATGVSGKEIDKAMENGTVKGFWMSKDGEVHLNMKDASSETMLHEGFHPVLDYMETNNPKVVVDLYKQLRGTEGGQRFTVDAARAYKGEGATTIMKEAITDFIASVADGQVKIDKTNFEAIRDFFAEAFNQLGFDFAKTDVMEMKNAEQLKNLAGLISEKFKKGEEVKPSDITASDYVDASGKVIPEGKIQFNIANSFSDIKTKTSFEYIKDTKEFDDLKKAGVITADKKLADFAGKDILLHSPDGAFTGRISKDGGLLVEGKGGLYYPIKFHNDGYFWAATKGGASTMVKQLNESAKRNGGKIYMALTSAPPEKLFSSTTVANAVIDIFRSKTLDKKIGLKEPVVKRAIINAAKSVKKVKGRMRLEDGNEKKNAALKKQYGEVKTDDMGQYVSYDKKVGLKLTSADLKGDMESIVSTVRKKLSTGKSTFADRKHFVESLISSVISKIKGTKTEQKLGSFLHEGISNLELKNITKKGYKLSATNTRQALAHMLQEPLLRGDKKGGKVYAILELDAKPDAKGNYVVPVESGKHESYPIAIKAADGTSKTKVHVLQDRQDWNRSFEDPETGAPVEQARQKQLFPSTGMSKTPMRLAGGEGKSPMQMSKGTSKVKNPELKEFLVAYAPFREGKITDISKGAEGFKDAGYQRWKKMADQFASDLGIKIAEDNNSIGVYGETSYLPEVSSVVKVEASLADAKLFGSLMGSMAPDGQHSVALLEYAKNGKTNEYRFTFDEAKNAENFVKNIKDYGIKDVSLLPESNTALILDKGNFNKEKFDNDYGKHIKDYDERQLNDHSVNQEDYAGIIGGARSANEKLNRGKLGENINDVLELAGERAGRLSRDYGEKSEQAQKVSREGVESYLAKNKDKFGVPEAIETKVEKIDNTLSKDITKAYEKLPVDDSKNPEVQRAYSEAGEQISAQFDHLTKDLGIKVEFLENDPYKNSAGMFDDIINNKTLKIFKGGEDHPFLGEASKDGTGLTLNEKLRAVHDYYGHFVNRNQFGRIGEERAWVEHSKMFSPEAQRAISTETRGQNHVVNTSGINKGALEKFREGNKLIKEGRVTEGNRIIAEGQKEFQFAPQKVALLPRELTDWTKYKAEAKAQFSKEKKKEKSVTLPDGRKVDVKPLPNGVDIVNGFYSPLEKTIVEAKQEKMPAKQWLDKFARGEEAKWTGLDEWLKAQEGSVAKSDIQKYLKENRIEIQEVVKGEGKWQGDDLIDGGETLATISENADGTWSYVSNFSEGTEKFNTKAKAKREAEAATIGDVFGEAGTKFSDYQLEGEKSDYKEVLVTLPAKPLTLGEYRNESARGGVVFGSEQRLKESYNDYLKDTGKDVSKTENFKSSHFDEPNILVHLRMNTRTAADGSKTLFLEEVQSDWGQKGKKEGFETPEKKAELKKLQDDASIATQKFNEIEEELDKQYADKKKEGESKSDLRKRDSDFNKLAQEYAPAEQKMFDSRRAFDMFQVDNRGEVPIAPFVTKTSEWVKLGLKTALQNAVKTGADKIAWTTGEQQNARYDLSKQVDHITYDTKDNSLVALDKDGNTVIGKTVPEVELEATIGKEAAQKLIDQKPNADGEKHLSNADLKVGGKGMTGFYGSPAEGKLGIVGDVAKKLFKQEPKTVEIIGDSTAKTVSVKKEGDYFWVNWERNGEPRRRAFKNKEAADDFAKSNETKLYTQHSIDITPQMRAEVEQGLPQFQKKRDILDRVDKVFEKEPKVKKPFKERIKNFIDNIGTHIVSEHTPLKAVEKKIYKKYGIDNPKVLLADKFENLKGAVSIAEQDVRDFVDAVVKPVKDMPDDFEAFLFLNRVKSRLESNPDLKKVGEWTVEQATEGLADLKDGLGEEKFKKIEEAADQYQRIMDASLQQQVQSGLLSKESYDAIKAENDFYARFAVLKHINDGGDLGKSRSSVTGSIVKTIKGIQTEADVKLERILVSSAEVVYKSRLQSEKNLKMQELGDLAAMDKDGEFFREVPIMKRPAVGKEIITYKVDGIMKALEADSSVAEPFNFKNSAETGFIGKMLNLGRGTFRFGATTANLSFLPVNLVFQDAARGAIISKYGIKTIGGVTVNPIDVVRFAGDSIYSFYTALTGNYKILPQTKAMKTLYEDLMKSPIMGYTFQRLVTPEAFKPKLDVLYKADKKSLAETSGEFVMSILDSYAKLTNAIEQTSKIAGYKRGLRMEGIDKLTGEARKKKMEEIEHEIINFYGSPPFLRMGKSTKNVNLLFMFFNARLQGVERDLSRLGRQGKASRDAYVRLVNLVALPTTALALYNMSDDNIEDYKKRKDWERENYFLIPREKYFINDDGEKIREYYRIPAYGAIKWAKNLIEASAMYSKEQMPSVFKDYGVSVLEDMLPVSVSGENAKERIESVVSSMNPMIKAPIEYGMGRNTFYHANTIPRRLEGLSPQNQWKKSTPEIFKKASELGAKYEVPILESTSPIELEQLFKSFSADLVTQFTTPLGGAQGDRPLWTTFPVLKRFVSSTHTEQQDDSEEILQAIKDQRDEKFALAQQADIAFDEIKGMKKLEQLEAIQKYKSDDRQLYDKLKEDYINAPAKLGYQDRLLRSLGVENGARAEFIAKKVNTMTKADRQKYIEDLKEKGLLSKSVKFQLRKIFNVTTIKDI